MISDADAIAPTKLQALVDCYRRGELTREDYLEYLRHDYHSVHARVRTEALALLDDLPEPERTRELIWLADECQWRETRIDIVRALGVKPLPRGLEFLIHLATDDADLGMCREAIAALGRSQEPLAARYLATRYQTGPPALKPYIAYALGELLDCTLAQQFLDDLRTAQRNEQILWTESLALALAELNVDTCIDTLVDMLRVQPRSVAISALLAMGKLAQEPDVLDAYISDFADDFVEWQMFTNARQQIELRARWSIEDYLDKIFDLHTAFHPRLVLALNRFAPVDVREGLEFFRDDKYRLDCGSPRCWRVCNTSRLWPGTMNSSRLKRSRTRSLTTFSNRFSTVPTKHLLPCYNSGAPAALPVRTTSCTKPGCALVF